MAYSDFTTMQQLKQQFGIVHKKTPLFAKSALVPVPASTILETLLKRAARLPLFTEKAKSESIIAPVLEEVWESAAGVFTYFSGFSFDVDKTQQLNGRCDFILSKEPDTIEITAPVFCVVEAKDRTVVEGIPQAFAEMYAACIFNEREGLDGTIMHGCVTNANEWIFLELHNKTIAQIDTVEYQTDTELPLLLANFQRIVKGF
jgi:hypothetical protein